MDSSFPLHQEAKNAKIVAESTLLLISAREEEQQQLKTPPKVSFASSPDHYETQRDSPFIASLESNEDTGILTRKMSESKSSPADVARCKVKLKETLQTVKPTLRNTNVSDAHLFHNVEGKDLTSPLRSYSTTESLLLIPTSGEDVKVNSPLRVSNASNHDPHSSRRDIPLVAPLDSESAKQASSPRTISNLKRSSLVISHDNEKVKESLQRLRPTTENADISNPQSIHSLERRVGKRASKAKQKKNATINDTDSLHQEMESDKVNSDSSLVNSPSEKDNAKAPLKILLLSESGHRRSRRNSPLVTPLDANMATLTFKRRQPSESKSLPIVALSNGNEEIQKVLQNARSTSTKAEVLESHFIQDLGERAGISPLIASQVSVPVIIDKGIPHQEIKHEKIVSEYPPLGKSAKREVRVIRAARKASFLCDTGISGTRRVNPLVTLSDSDIAKQKQKTIPISVLKTSYIPTSNIKGGTEEKLQKISTATKPDVSETHSFPSLEGKVGKSPLKAKQKMGQTLIDNNHLHQEVDNGENANVPFASGRVIRETSQNSPFVTLNDPETMKETQQPSRTRNILSSSTLLSLPFPRSPLRESDGVSPLTVESRLQHRGTTHAGGDLNQQTRVSLEEGVAPITRSESPTLDHRLEKAYTLFPAKEWSLPFKSSLISLTLQGTKPPDVRSQNVRDQGKLDSVERDSATATLCQAQEIIGINQATNDEGVEASVTTKKETTDLVPSKFQPTSIFRPFTFPSNNGMAKMRAPTVTELVDVVTTVPFISDCESKGDLPEDGSDSDVSSLYSDMDAWSAPSFATEELEYRPRKQGVTQKISTARSPVKWGQVERKHLSQPQGDLAHHSSVRALSKSWLRDVDLENIPRYQLPNTSIGRRSLKLSPDNDEDILRREGEIPTKISRDNAPIVASASDVKVGGVVRKGWFTPSLASEQLVKKSPNQNVSDYEATRSQVRHSPPGDDGFGCKERKAFSDSLLSDNAIMAKPSVQESPILSWFGLASSIVLFRKSECDKKTTEILEPRLKTDALLKQVLPPPALIPPSPVQILFPAVAENSYASEGEPDEIFDIAMTNSDSVSDEVLVLDADEVSLKHDPLALIPFTPVQILSPKLAENSVTSEGEPDEILEFAMTNHNSVSDEVIVVLDSDEVSLKHDPLAVFPFTPVQILSPAVAENSFDSEGEPDEIFDLAMTNSDSVSDEALILVSDEVSLKHDPLALIPFTPVQILSPKLAENSVTSEGEPDEILEFAMTNHNSVSDEVIVVLDSDEVSLKHDPLAVFPFTPVQILSPAVAENSFDSEGEPDEIFDLSMTNPTSVSEEVLVLASDEVSFKHDPLALIPLTPVQILSPELAENSFDSEGEPDEIIDFAMTNRKRVFDEVLVLDSYFGTNEISLAVLDNGSDHEGVDTYEAVDHTFTDPNGESDIFTGSLSIGLTLPEGLGKMVYNRDGQVYDGEWKEGRWNGKGTLNSANGDVYEGEFLNDQRHGTGTYTWKSGRQYIGGFALDERHGKGTFAFSDGSLYIGDFKNGNRHGSGRCDFPEGGYYEGEWQNNLFEGQGECVWPDGRSYRGQFSRNQSHGMGIEKGADGQIIHDGLWEADEPVT